MPCPFPGMDPWLEAPTEWPGFHDTLVIKTMEVLQPQLRSLGYYARPGERVYLTQGDHTVVPDIVIIPRPPLAGPSVQPKSAVLAVDEPELVTRPDFQVHEGYLDIHHANTHELVTCLEFISPSNKSNSEGRELYQRKQGELADEGVHLVEIDLLRAGRHVLDVPLWVVNQNRPWDYLINLARRGSPRYEFYRIHVRQRLPRIRVPLKSEDADAALDLQDVFARAYEISPYPDRLDYSQPPDPPLADEDAAWAKQLLTEKGLL